MLRAQDMHFQKNVKWKTGHSAFKTSERPFWLLLVNNQKRLKRNTLLRRDNSAIGRPRRQSINSDTKLEKGFSWVFCLNEHNLRNSTLGPFP